MTLFTRWWRRHLDAFTPPRPWWDDRPSTVELMRTVLTVPESDAVYLDPAEPIGDYTVPIVGQPPAAIVNHTRLTMTLTGYGDTVTIEAGQTWERR